MNQTTENQPYLNRRLFKKINLSALSLFIFSFNLFAQTNLTRDEYAVYDTVLESRYPDTLKQSSVKLSFIISDETVTINFIPSQIIFSKPLSEFLDERLTRYPRDLVNDFKGKNQISVKLKKQSPSGYEYYIVSKTELEQLLKEGRKDTLCPDPCSLNDGWAWQILRKKYPGSGEYSKFSRIGFSSDKNLAVVFINNETAGHGDSMFYTLERSEGKWKVKEYIWVTSWDT